VIERSEAAKHAKHIFFSNYNDIDIFIEDTAIESKKIFTEILRRVFKSSISIHSIFPLGPKSTVIRRWKSDQGKRKKMAIYIVDGDYDLATGPATLKAPRLYRLNKYCIENYLIDYKAIAEVINDGALDMDFESTTKMLGLDDWKNNAIDPLNLLTGAMIAASKKQCDNLPTVKIDLRKIQKEKLDKVCPKKVSALVEHYKTAVNTKHGDGAFENELNALLAINNGSGIDFRINASGKNIILPLIRKRIERRLNFMIDDFRVFKAKLAARCDISDLNDLPDFVA
jgi:hypothetical protein